MTMRFRLRTLLIVLAMGPVVLYGGYRLAERFAYTVICEHGGSEEMRLVAEQMEAEGYVPPDDKPSTASQTVVRNHRPPGNHSRAAPCSVSRSASLCS